MYSVIAAFMNLFLAARPEKANASGCPSGAGSTFWDGYRTDIVRLSGNFRCPDTARTSQWVDIGFISQV